MGRKFPNLTAAKNYSGASYQIDVNIHFAHVRKEIPEREFRNRNHSRAIFVAPAGILMGST
jgi:hypothetical protein